MKTRPSLRPGHGFTLIELLVVISIIAVLATLALTGARIAMNRAKVLAAKTDENSLQRAIDGYVAEYSKLPAFSRDEIDTTSAEGRELITILQGTEKSGTDEAYEEKVVKVARLQRCVLPIICEAEEFSREWAEA